MKESIELFSLYFKEMLHKVILFSPKFFGALGLLLVGILIAKSIEKIGKRIFVLLGVNRISKKSGLENLIKSINIKTDFATILSKIIFWIILLIFLIPIIDILGLTVLSELINQTVAFVPKILVAFLIILIGSWVGKVVSGIMSGSAHRLNSEYASLIGSLANFFIITLTILIALTQLNIRIDLLKDILIIFFASIALALSLAFALGVKNVLQMILVSHYISRYHKRNSVIKFEDFEGTIEEVGPLMTTIKTKDGQIFALPNYRFIQSQKDK